MAKNQPKLLSKNIQHGIPSKLRGMIWQLFSKSKDLELEGQYNVLLKQASVYEKMIQRDLARTFPGIDYFRDKDGVGQEALFNVVKAYSLYDEEVGYCQGLAFVVGPLLLNASIESYNIDIDFASFVFLFSSLYTNFENWAARIFMSISYSNCPFLSFLQVIHLL